MKKITIVPTIFAKNKDKFSERFKKLVPLANGIQIDIMDGRFVKSKGIEIKDIPSLKKYSKDFEAHLMIESPEHFIHDLKLKGFKKIIFHYEAMRDIDAIKRIIFLIRMEKMKAFIAFNPETNFNEILGVLGKVERLQGVMFMGVNPGKENQELNINTIRKIRNIHQEFGKIPLEVDGGVNDRTAAKLVEAGATILSSGSFVANSKDPKKAIEKLRDAGG